MVSRRYNLEPRFTLSIWKKDGTLWYADPDSLRAIIQSEGVPDSDIRARMGHGYFYIQDILDGKRIGKWAVKHIEFGILQSERNPNGPTGY